MFRTTAARAVPRSFTSLTTSATRTTLSRYAQQAKFRTSTRPVKAAPVLALSTYQPLQKSLVRYASGGSKVVLGRDTEGEKAIQTQKVIGHPEFVSASSSVHPVTGEVGMTEEAEKEVDMMAGIRSDFVRRIGTSAEMDYTNVCRIQF